MSTSTAKLGLVKGAGVDNVSVVAHINGAFDKIDLALPTQVCTSGTRPGTPFAGQMIWETDTLNVMVYTGTRWWPLNSSYDTAAARDTALSSPQEGMLVWIEDTNTFSYYNGSAWAELHVGSGADTGWVTATTGWTAATNWTLGTVKYRVKNGVVSMYFDVDRTTSAITVPSTGNIANIDVLSAIPTVIRPGSAAYGYAAGTGRGAWFTIGTGGTVTINSVSGTADLAIAESVSCFATYFKD